MTNTERPERVSLREYGRRHDRAPSTASGWKSAGYLELDEDGMVLVEPSDARLLERGLGRFTGVEVNGHPNGTPVPNGKPTTWSEARRRKELALARLREFEVAERQKELVRTEAVFRWIEGWAIGIRQAVESFVPRYTLPLSGELGTNPKELAPILDKYMDKLLTDLADAIGEPTLEDLTDD